MPTSNCEAARRARGAYSTDNSRSPAAAALACGAFFIAIIVYEEASMRRQFLKMHGAGNDYIYFDCLREPIADMGGVARRLSDRHKGIGGDGAVFICPSEVADARMRMFNADGSEGNMCGNAIRCVGKYLFDSGIVPREEMRIETKSGIKQLLVPGMFFEDMDITYLGPVDGHDIRKLVKVFNEAKRVDHAVLVHVITKKGKGYPPAEENPAKFHGTGPFNIETGEATEISTTDSYTQVFSKVLTDIAKKDDKVVAITAAMADGTGLSTFAKHFPNRFFDVGIAEEHAMTFAAGLAAGGMKPVFAVYSSFLQRSYDQTLHDVCLQNLPVVIAVDRAGLVGSDGETHQGVFDLSFLSTIPNMTVISPKNRWEMADMLRFAVDFPYPIAIRYPRGSAYEGMREFRAPVEYGKSEILYEEEDIAVIFVGHMAELADRVRRKLKDTGYSCSLVNARFVKPFDRKMLEYLAKDHCLFVTIEENVLTGGFGEQVMDYVFSAKLNVHVRNIGISDDYVEHGNVEILRKEVGLDCDTIVKQTISDYLMIKDR